MQVYWRHIRQSIIILFVLSMFFGLSSICNAAEGKISATEKKAYLELASQVPANIAFSLLFGSPASTLAEANAILKKYEATDQSFDLEKFILAMKGGLGFNPLSLEELEQAGFDSKKGLAVFSLGSEGAPLLVFQISNPETAKTTLNKLADQMMQAKPLPDTSDPKAKGATIRMFTSDGTPAGKLMMVFAILKKKVYLMSGPTAPEWFTRHLHAAVSLRKSKSLASERHFKKLLGRLEAGTSFINYANYKKYVQGLKDGTDLIRAQIPKVEQEGNPLALMDELAAFAEGFDAQIFGLSLNRDRIRFVHELIGPRKKVKEFRKFFPIGKNGAFSKLKLSDSGIGMLYGSLDFKAVIDHVSGRNPDFKLAWSKMNEEMKQIANMSFNMDVLDKLGHEVAVIFYGMGKIPESITSSPSVSEKQMLSCAQLVIVAGLSDVQKTKAVVNQAIDGLKTQGKQIKEYTAPGGERFSIVKSEGLPIQFGVYKDTFMLGIGRDAVKTAVTGNLAMKVAPSSKTIARLTFDFGKFTESMENLRPPADSPNTQLHQQYKVWKDQVASKLLFMNDIEINAVQLSDGFRTFGEIRF